MKIIRLIKYSLVGVFCVMLASCGGGGSSGGGGGSGVVSKGTITGFGSVLVNGVEFETEGAEIQIEDELGDVNELRLGMVVTVRGSVDTSGSKGSADSIEFEDNLEGPITGDDDVAKTITVLGQTVKWDISTRCENSSSASIDCATLVVNNLVEVSGLPATSGSILATRIEIKKISFNPADEVELKGTISSLDTTAKTFFIGSQKVDYGTAVLEDVPNKTLVKGMFVEVKGTLDFSLVVLNATKIELEEEGLEVQENQEEEIEGLVSDFTSPCSGLDCTFKVNGQPVQTNSATGLKNGAPSDIANGVRVEVEGTITNGVLIAREVSFL